MHLGHGAERLHASTKPNVYQLPRLVPQGNDLLYALERIGFAEMRRDSDPRSRPVAECDIGDPVVRRQYRGRPEPQLSSQVSVGMEPPASCQLNEIAASPVFVELKATSEMIAVSDMVQFVAVVAAPLPRACR